MAFLYFLAVGATAFVVSLARLLATNPQALSTLVWAEDGLFPLCVKQHGYLACLLDPYAGYSLFLSRTLAVPVSWFPLEAWPYSTNLVAAASLGVLSALIAWTLVRSGVGRAFAFLAALVPTAAPIVGFEAINAAGSAYMSLLVLGALMVSLPSAVLVPKWVLFTVLLVTALTMPSAAVLFAPLGVMTLVRHRSVDRFVLGSLGLLVGLVVQGITAITTENPRPVSLSSDSLRGWVEGLPTAITTLWPSDVVLGPTGVLESPSAIGDVSVGWLALSTLVIAVAVTVAIGIRTRVELVFSIGIFLGTGILLGAVPAIGGFANNRYYVVPVVAIAMAAVLIASMLGARREILGIGVIGAVMIVLWWPGFAASSYRATASPQWLPMLFERQQVCLDGAQAVPLTFTPNWPFADAQFPGVTSNVVPCDLVTGLSLDTPAS